MPPNNPCASDKKRQALVLLQNEKFEEARSLLEEACELDREDAQAWRLLGVIHGMLGDMGKAEFCCRRAIALQPGSAEARANLGVALEKQGRLEEALQSYQEAVHLDPGHVNAPFNMGNVLKLLGRMDEAGECYRRALALRPDDAGMHVNLGAALAAQKRYPEAIVSYQAALAIRPDYSEAHNNLGAALAAQNQHDAAVNHYRRALAIKPDYAEACHNLGNALSDQYKLEEAIECYQRAIEIDPDYVEALCNLGVAFGKKGWRDRAIACYRRALQIKPDADAHFNLALIYLLTGNFKEGWNEYAWNWLRESSAPRPFPPTPWDGSDLAGRSIFLHAEQGLGDEIFFLRFVNQLRQRGAGHIAYRPSKKIAGLLVRVPAINLLVDPQATPPPSDFIFSVGDLPKLLDMERIDQIPPPLALGPLPEKLEGLRARLQAFGPAPYLGVTWRAGTRRKDGVLFKECPVALLARTLRDAPGTILVLQRHSEAGEIGAFASALERPAHDLSPLNDDLESMLALLALLDEYVGVSNTNMHLRAGVGKTARVLVPAPPEWRWMAEGKESPWFPGFGVYRQGYDGDWTQALAQLESDLRDASGYGRR
jgi:tetratricopeptide (TPR) repeat protein